MQRTKVKQTVKQEHRYTKWQRLDLNPRPKTWEKSETIAISIGKQNRMSDLSSVCPFPNPLPWFHLPA